MSAVDTSVITGKVIVTNEETKKRAVSMSHPRNKGSTLIAV